MSRLWLGVAAGAMVALCGCESDGPLLGVVDAAVGSAVDAAIPNRPPAVTVGQAIDTYTGQATAMAATVSDVDGDPLTVMWTVLTRPAGSQVAIAAPTASQTTFTPDVDGIYELEVAVSDGQATTRARLDMRAHHPIRALASHVLDAEYSRALDAVVYVSEQPNRLHVVSTRDAGDLAVTLPLVPTSVSVAPDGLTAAVGHDGWITHVRLTDGTILESYPITIQVLDVVLAANGYVYGFPLRDQWSAIHTINLATGAETTSSTASIYAGTVAKLHPAGKAMYGANNGLSPSDIERYDIRNGTALVERDSPYHGDYAMCGDLWISDDGLRIFTACGNAFRATDTPATDMTYNGSLEGLDFVQFVDHASITGKIVAVPAVGFFDPEDDLSFEVYDDAFLAHERTVHETRFHVGPAWLPATSRFGFISSDGMEVHIITQAAAGSGLLADCALATYPL